MKRYTYTRSMPAAAFVERHLLTLLLTELSKLEFYPVRVLQLQLGSRSRTVKGASADVTMPQIWQVMERTQDAVRVHFEHELPRFGNMPGRITNAWVELYTGNGEDVVHDYSALGGEFDKAMRRVFLK